MVTGGKGSPPEYILNIAEEYRTHMFCEERKSPHSPACSFRLSVLSRGAHIVMSSRIALMESAVGRSIPWKTFLFRASQIFQRMIRNMKERTEVGNAVGNLVEKRSLIGVKHGRMEVACQMPRAAGHEKNRCS